jgi:hypothetical protein
MHGILLYLQGWPLSSLHCRNKVTAGPVVLRIESGELNIE